MILRAYKTEGCARWAYNWALAKKKEKEESE